MLPICAWCHSAAACSSRARRSTFIQPERRISSHRGSRINSQRMSLTEDAGCRILVISPTTEQAQQFVQRVKVLSGASSPQSSVPDAPSSIPWTIANKYYTADVHFHTRSFADYGAQHAVGVPAIIYVWAHGEPYRDHIPDISKSLEYYDPEVSLAVRFANNNTITADEEDGLDEFLSTHGFEFVEGDRVARRPTQEDGSASDEENAGVPGLPRVIDALSTIMWPSIVQSDATRQRKSRARELLNWARDEEEDDGLRSLIPSEPPDASPSAGAPSAAAAPAKKSRMQREMEELERWLADEDGKHEDAAWGAGAGAADSWPAFATPTIVTPTADSAPIGFDDDFTEFVSAPSPRQPSAGMLLPMHTGASYRSLASLSDFGDASLSMPDKDEDEDEEDADLPSRAEIAETSRRIFGAAVSPGLVPDPDLSAGSDDFHAFEHHADDDEFELSAFDLSRVLSALQGMKEEISGMDDEAERRKAAARVALGLVYGLQAEKAHDEDFS
ncbi:hypothetical protein B0H21DRAFT_755983 [Amylocystis lapponica]|nr:hypothetical protein B0H21DRAFT_755983 [Amylocystis lapponica]